MTRKALFKNHNISKDRLKRAVTKYEEGHPDWFKNYRTESGNQIALHYSPEFINGVLLAVTDPVPEGWKTLYDVRLELKKSRKFVEEALDKLGKQYPDQTGFYLNVKRQVYTYYSPSLILQLKTGLGIKIPTVEADPVVKRMVELGFDPRLVNDWDLKRDLILEGLSQSNRVSFEREHTRLHTLWENGKLPSARNLNRVIELAALVASNKKK